MYAIVDIETTGGQPAAFGITEICIILFDGEEVLQQYHTLVNPLQQIPPYIQSMTGISNAMVKHAPVFSSIAADVYTLLKENIFVAHNVGFDYLFIHAALLAAGYSLNTPQLCTVKLAQKLLPGHPSYSLGRLCESLGIVLSDRHRASGDAKATVELFKKILAHNKNGHVEKNIQKSTKAIPLPVNLPKEQFDQLPYTPGVFHFYDHSDKLLYTGKAKNIRSKVITLLTSHRVFSKAKFSDRIYTIRFEPCGTELIAEIMAQTANKTAPLYKERNKQPKGFSFQTYTDTAGYNRILIEAVKNKTATGFTCKNRTAAIQMLHYITNKFSLCPVLNYLETPKEQASSCIGNQCKGACTRAESATNYNIKVQAAITSLITEPSFIIIDKGIRPNELSCILIEEGRLYGVGYIPQYHKTPSLNSIKESIEKFKENNYPLHILKEYAAKHPKKVIYFNNT